MCEYGFSEGEDFNLLKNERVQNEGGRTVRRIIDDAQLTIEMAKELCMLQRNDKGKQARQYFIELEKRWNTPELVMARALKLADNKIRTLEDKIEQDKPKVFFADALDIADNAISINDLAKLLSQNGIDIGQKRLFEWLRENGYLCKHGREKNRPTQRSMEMKLFEIKEWAITRPDGSIKATFTPKVTGKGQQYFIKKFLTAS
jgi:anti-repressor protein